MTELKSTGSSSNKFINQNLQLPWKNHRLHEINHNDVRLKFLYKTTWLFLLSNKLMYINNN